MAPTFLSERLAKIQPSLKHKKRELYGPLTQKAECNQFSWGLKAIYVFSNLKIVPFTFSPASEIFSLFISFHIFLFATFFCKLWQLEPNFDLYCDQIDFKLTFSIWLVVTKSIPAAQKLIEKFEFVRNR